jgi:hypothetical protein
MLRRSSLCVRLSEFLLAAETKEHQERDRKRGALCEIVIASIQAENKMLRENFKRAVRKKASMLHTHIHREGMRGASRFIHF